MRHDEHYVDALTSSAGSPIGRMIPIDQISPNPNQPRQVMGDLSELMASIAEKGIIEPIIVRQRGTRFQIVAGERRYQAAVQLGLTEVPVVIRDVDDAEVIEIALVENLQRKDLTPFEEAEGYRARQTLQLEHLLQRTLHAFEQIARPDVRGEIAVRVRQARPEDVPSLVALFQELDRMQADWRVFTPRPGFYDEVGAKYREAMRIPSSVERRRMLKEPA